MGKPRSPRLARFLSDFTLGFSDGLTVPFALTAGLGSLGRADTVIYAGLAELCAGSISMGIGGYLSALDTVPSASSQRGSLDDEELRGILRRGSAGSSDDEKHSDGDGELGPQEELVRCHLEPLALPDSTLSDIMAALRRRPGGLARVALQLETRRQPESTSDSSSSPPPAWPVASGLSISLGYSVGGIIPLVPYFFAATVGLGLRWSIGLCLAALMAFGAGKSWVLGGGDSSWGRSLRQGLQMLVLGSLAAGTAVLCVNLVGA